MMHINDVYKIFAFGVFLMITKQVFLMKISNRLSFFLTQRSSKYVSGEHYAIRPTKHW